MGHTPVRVRQLNNYIGRILRNDPMLSSISVLGEISNLKFHSSGHVYFSLKDSDSKVNCFLAAGNLQYISVPLEEGTEIIASGYISVYERGGYYSLNVRNIEINGAGQLALRFEELKKKLEREGLFDVDMKKPLPVFPQKVAVVTSETGAAVQDIIKTIKEKNNYTDILIFPVLVQGPAAASDIASTIDVINSSHSDVNVIIVGRGGGSMEELWAFNEEKVARSIFNSKIPVISAVGHETDFTISDFVADFRATTPTAAGEAAVPDIRELLNSIDRIKEESRFNLINLINISTTGLEALNPLAFTGHIQSRIDYEQMNADRIVEEMKSAINDRIVFGNDKIKMLKEIIEASNPKSILMRGYSVVTDSEGKIINTAESLKPGDTVTIETSKGSACANITKVL